MGFKFTPQPTPFPRWKGPYSPARGVKKWSGFRFYQGKLGTWVSSSEDLEFWQVERSPGTASLEALIRGTWHYGRILILPDGRVIKPDPAGDGVRYFIGQIQGRLVLVRPDGTRCDIAGSRSLSPGTPWPGPGTTGIEGKIDQEGRIECSWDTPERRGILTQTVEISEADPTLAAGLHRARPGETGARVRIQAGGVVITNSARNDDFEVVWTPYYLGRIDVSNWPFKAKWLVR